MDRMTLLVALLAVALTATALLFMGAWSGLSAAVGGVIAVVNWYLYRWVVLRVTTGSVRKHAALMVLLAAKMVALATLVYFLITRHWVEPLGFLLGVSALVGGLLFGSARYLWGGQAAESEH